MRGSSNARLDAHLPIHVAPVPYTDDIHHPLSIIEAIHDSVVSDPDAPELLGALQLLRPWRTRVAREPLDRAKMRAQSPGSRDSNSRRAERAKVTAYSSISTEIAPAAEPLPHRRQGLSRLRLTRLRDHAVTKVLPQVAMPPQIDHDRSLFALVVDHELNSLDHCPS